MDREEIKQIAYDYTTSKVDAEKLEERILSLFPVSCMFAYHPENEEVGRVFRNTITNKWYYDEGLAEIIGWSNVEKLKET